MFALLRDRPEFDSATTQLRMLDSSGRLVDARVTWVRTIVPGPMPQCGYFAQPDKPARLILDGPLLPADWTVELNYLANSDGSMTLSLSRGTRGQGSGASGTQPGLRPAAGRRRRDHRAGQHHGAVVVHRVGTGGFPRSRLGESNS